MFVMFLEIDGLPLHPLVVHAPIVLVPLLVLLSLAYVVIPPVRRHIGWAVFLLTILAPVAVYFARLSGKALSRHENFTALANAINEHEGFSTVLFWLLVALAPVTWLFVVLERARRAARARRLEPRPIPDSDDDGTTGNRQLSTSDVDPVNKGRMVVMIVVGLIMLGLAGAAAYYAYKTGDTGARMAWEDSLG